MPEAPRLRAPPPTPQPRPSVVVIGVGNALRHDDAAGLEVVRAISGRASSPQIAVQEQEGETLGMLEQWDGARAVVLVDAVQSGCRPGTIHRCDVSSVPVPTRLRSSSSTHAVGLGEAIELARTLHRLPERVLLYGVEGSRFDAGSGLSQEVQAVIPALADRVLGEALELAG